MDADQIVRLIRARCPELAPDDMRMIETLPLIMDAIDALMERTDRLEAATGGEGGDREAA